LLDKTSGQRREVDVSIRMTVGSVPVLILVECRDRRKPAGSDWIEQIAQKAVNVRAAKVVAVSASGFTSGAVKMARTLAIETRRIREITADHVRDWCRIGEVVIFHAKSVLHHTSLELPSTAGDQFDDEDVRIARSWSYEDRHFIRKIDGTRLGLNAIHQAVMNDPKAWRGIRPGAPKKSRQVIVTYPTTNDRYQFPARRGPLDIVRIALHVDQWIERLSAPLKRVLAYQRDNETVAQVAQYEAGIGPQNHLISFHREMATARTTIAMQVEGGTLEAVDSAVPADDD
jgi:hypothetical protein